jgi:hypothetical protein
LDRAGASPLLGDTTALIRLIYQRRQRRFWILSDRVANSTINAELLAFVCERKASRQELCNCRCAPPRARIVLGEQDEFIPGFPEEICSVLRRNLFKCQSGMMERCVTSAVAKLIVDILETGQVHKHRTECVFTLLDLLKSFESHSIRQRSQAINVRNVNQHSQRTLQADNFRKQLIKQFVAV